jgi:hypothetical protein
LPGSKHPEDTQNLAARQAAFVERRCGLSLTHAALVASIAFETGAIR